MLPLQRPLLLAFAIAATACAAHQRNFATPHEAVNALAASGDDPARADELLGPGESQLLFHGSHDSSPAASSDDSADDSDDDCVDLATVCALIHARVEFVDDGDGRKLALIGDDGFELPIPLVRDRDGWHFDVESGNAEVCCRCVGHKELRAIATLHSLVEAQREYAATAGAGAGEPPSFAMRWSSHEGTHDGLCWDDASSSSAATSPIGPLFCRCAATSASESDPKRSAPCHGYAYRILTCEGVHASGVAKNYVDDQGRMTRGFAFLAWPVEYGRTGVMTFLVNHLGIVFEKDLGPDTASAADSVDCFDPDSTWSPTLDPEPQPELDVEKGTTTGS